MIDGIYYKSIITEGFQDYKTPYMFIGTCYCDWKCGREICQNISLQDTPNNYIDFASLFKYYIYNNITKSIAIGGLEPFLQIEEVISLIRYFREHGCNDPIIIYTGYNKEEIQDELSILKKFNNIIIKFGRYISNDEPVFDEVLGITLASSNQYAEKL